MKKDHFIKIWEEKTLSQKICGFLSQNEITYEKCVKHPEVSDPTKLEEYDQKLQEQVGEDYCVCKNRLIQEKEGKKRTFLFIIPCTKQIDLQKTKELLKTEDLEIRQGENCSLYHLLSDQNEQIHLVLDHDVLKGKGVVLHPLYNGLSIFLKPKETLNFLSLWKDIYQLSEVPAIIREKQKVREKNRNER